MTSLLTRPPQPSDDWLAGASSTRVGRSIGPSTPTAGWPRSPRPSWPWVIAAAAVGTVVIGCSYRLSALGASADLYYLVFWIGMFVALLPAGAKVVAGHVSRTDQLLGIMLFGWLTAVPKFLRNPTGPRYHDEYAHWRQAVDVLASGQLFEPNAVIPIVQFFPGTAALTVTTSSLSGLSVWSAGVVVVLVAHIAGLFAVYVATRSLLDSRRGGGIAAIVYGINPSAIYFDTQYAYESVAMAFFLWTVALTALAGQPVSPGRRRRLLLAATMTAAGVVVTHHLSTVFLIAILGVVAATVTLCRLVARYRGDSEPRYPVAVWWTTLTATVTLGTLWVGFFARPTLVYLSPYFGSSVDQLSSMADTDGDGGRELMSANVQPFAEQLVTAAAPATLAVLVVVVAVLVVRRRVRPNPAVWGLMVFGCAYFVSLPFLLAPSGAEGARRSWGFTYLGIAVLVALVALHWPAAAWRPGPAWRKVLAVSVFGTLLVGNVGGGLNDPYRFPGPFRWGTDTNSASDEARAVAEVFHARVGRVSVVTNAYTGLAMTAYGGAFAAAPSPGFPAWLLTQSGEDPPKELAAMLVSSDYDYLVVDIRMGEEVPFNGHNYGQGDPLLGQATPMNFLTRLDTVSWAARVITTEHLRVYRLDLRSIATRPQGRP